MSTSSSQLLSLYSLARHLDENLAPPAHDIGMETTNFNAVCRSVDIILAAKRGKLQINIAADTHVIWYWQKRAKAMTT